MADQDDAPELHITVGAHQYVMRAAEFSAVDARDFRAATGIGLGAAMNSPDLDLIAGFVWLIRRKRERNLRYEQVAREINWDNLDVDRPGGGDGEGEGGGQGED